MCGTSTIDVELLKRHTKYHRGFPEDCRTATMLWEIIGEMSNRERQRLVRFAWGRSKLPRGKAGWIDGDGKEVFFNLSPFLIDRQGDGHLEMRGDESLVEAHTCFFWLKMPRYSCKPVMRERLQTSVANGLVAGMQIA